MTRADRYACSTPAAADWLLIITASEVCGVQMDPLADFDPQRFRDLGYGSLWTADNRKFKDLFFCFENVRATMISVGQCNS